MAKKFLNLLHVVAPEGEVDAYSKEGLDGDKVVEEAIKLEEFVKLEKDGLPVITLLAEEDPAEDLFLEGGK